VVDVRDDGDISNVLHKLLNRAGQSALRKKKVKTSVKEIAASS
jgi:hypothetical protein